MVPDFNSHKGRIKYGVFCSVSEQDGDEEYCRKYKIVIQF